MIPLSTIRDMPDDAKRVLLPFNLSSSIYPCDEFRPESIFGVENARVLKDFQQPVLELKWSKVKDLQIK